LNFERDARRATIDGEPIELSPREWLLLGLLLAQRDKVVTKDVIAESFAVERGASGLGSGRGSVEVYIHRVRRKLAGSGLAIRTVHGLGYVLERE
jgi:two-component system, OmpR family, response regulator